MHQCLEWMALMLIGLSLTRSMQEEKNNHAPLFNVGSLACIRYMLPLDKHDLKSVGNWQNFEIDV